MDTKVVKYKGETLEITPLGGIIDLSSSKNTIVSGSNGYFLVQDNQTIPIQLSPVQRSHIETIKNQRLNEQGWLTIAVGGSIIAGILAFLLGAASVPKPEEKPQIIVIPSTPVPSPVVEQGSNSGCRILCFGSQ